MINNKSLYRSWLLKCVLFFVSFSLIPVVADIDAVAPPGMPHGWDRPVPPPETPSGMSGDNNEGHKTRAGAKPPVKIDAVMRFNVLKGFYTPDLPNHINVSLPETERIPPSWQRRGTGTGEGKKNTPMDWNFIPSYSPYVVMNGMAFTIMEKMHPETTSKAAVLSHLINMGYPAVEGAKAARAYGNEKLVKKLEKLVAPIPKKRPTAPEGETPYETMLNRLVVTELVSGFPTSGNPGYGSRLRQLGEKALYPVLRSSREDHVFLKRNAAAFLRKFRKRKAAARLREIVKNCRDSVVKIRAIQGLIRLRDKKAMDIFVDGLSSRSPVVQSISAYGLGFVGTKEQIPDIISAARGGNVDTLWACLPALARIEGKDDRVQDFVTGLQLPNSKRKVLDEMVALAAAAHGSSKAEKFVKKRLKSNDESFSMATQYLLVDVLRELDGGPGLLKEMAFGSLLKGNKKKGPRNRGSRFWRRTANYAISKFPESGVPDKVMSEFKEELKKALDGRVTSARPVVCFLKLGRLDPEQAEDIALEKMKSFGEENKRRGPRRRRGGGPNANQASFIQQALGLMGKHEKLTVDVLLKVIKKARKHDLYAHREDGGKDPWKRGSGKWRVSGNWPGLLEQALKTLGANVDDPNEKVLSLLKDLLKSDKKAVPGVAALSLGLMKRRKTAPILSNHLMDENPWVRACSYIALRRMTDNTKEAYQADWIYGEKSKRKQAAKKWKKLVNKKYGSE